MEYFPLGDELTFEQALVQASQALDLTVMIALEQKDSERMLDVAGTWVKLADFMMGITEALEKKELDKKSDFPTGFQAALPDIENEDKEEDARDEPDGADARKRVTWL